MGWVVLWVWVGAVVLAAVVLGFCSYELTWKGSRLKRDLDRLAALSSTVTALQSDVAVTRRRLADVER